MNKIKELKKIPEKNYDVMLKLLLESQSDAAFEQVSHAASLAEVTGHAVLTPSGLTCFQQGIEIGTILNQIHIDSESIAAAILLPCVKYAELSLDDIAENVGQRVAKLICGAQKMDSISEFYQISSGSVRHSTNIDNIRKMMLAMVDDIRVVIIKLAERLSVLRYASFLPEQASHTIASEIMAIYAPLTNRLGIQQLKWELEDLAFKILEPKKYQEILSEVNKNFPEREQYINNVIAAVKDLLMKNGLQNFSVKGRAKHVYSIYKKMLRKHKSLNALFDICAIRVFVSSLADCYSTLSHIHAEWKNIPEEFDDYIASPKPNGYRSIHTAVFGPDNRVVEIQIRTEEMHKLAELGIAAHWVYKENRSQSVGYDTKIAWLREVLDWQQEVTKKDAVLDEIRQVFNDMIYVFTPQGDVLDLIIGATPLDFAYHVHSDVGHRTIGAKVNGKIVPLTYNLKTGDRVEILTAKNPSPSRDWLNPNLGYLKTSRARSKVFSWFKKESQDKHIASGQEIIDKETKHLGIKKIDLEFIARKLNFNSANELLNALGNGVVKFSSILHAIELKKEPLIVSEQPIKLPSRDKRSAELKVSGVENLLTRIAGCCKPLPGEAITGYVTQNQGITVHRKSCANIINASSNKPERLIEVSWGALTKKHYPVDILVSAQDRHGLVRDVTNVLADAGISVAGLDLVTDKKENTAKILMTIEIESVATLNKVLAKISKVSHVLEARRR